MDTSLVAYFFDDECLTFSLSLYLLVLIMIQTYKQALSPYIKTDHAWFFWKGRVALYCFLKSLGLWPGDEVIVPGFTCVVVANAILYVGAKPIYVDIEADTLVVPVSHYKAAITKKTKAIIVQNTLGLSLYTQAIHDLAKQHGICSIDDCTHGFGGETDGKANGAICDASFFSTQWNKPFSTGLGGIMVINSKQYLAEFEKEYAKMKSPSWLSQLSLLGLVCIRKLCLNAWTYWFLMKWYRFLSRHHLILGSSLGEELQGIQKPKDYEKRMGCIQLFLGVQALKKFPQQLKQRQEMAKIYTQFLTQHQKWHVPTKLMDQHTFLKYPILVKNRAKFMEKAQKDNVPLGDWFLSPLHPIKEGFDRWELETQTVPVAVDISQKILNLPTDVKTVQSVLDFLEKNKDDLL